MIVEPIRFINFSRYFLLLIPLILLQLGLMIAAIVSIAKKDEKELRPNSKLFWLLVVILVNIIGPILYFILGSSNNSNNYGGYNESGNNYRQQ